MVARNAEKMESVRGPILEKARQNGVDVRVLTREKVLAMAPCVSPAAVGGLYVPGESLVDPFCATKAFAEDAGRRGAEVILGDGVAAVREGQSGETVVLRLTSGRELEARCVVNAAGLWFAALAGDTSFRPTPRKGQFLLSEDDLGIDHISCRYPTPSPRAFL